MRYYKTSIGLCSNWLPLFIVVIQWTAYTKRGSLYLSLSISLCNILTQCRVILVWSTIVGVALCLAGVKLNRTYEQNEENFDYISKQASVNVTKFLGQVKMPINNSSLLAYTYEIFCGVL
jgi:hypothetical protein